MNNYRTKVKDWNLNMGKRYMQVYIDDVKVDLRNFRHRNRNSRKH